MKKLRTVELVMMAAVLFGVAIAESGLELGKWAVLAALIIFTD